MSPHTTTSGSTALPSSARLSPLRYPNEPSLRVTPSNASLSSLRNFIYITDSIIAIPEHERGHDPSPDTALVSVSSLPDNGNGNDGGDDIDDLTTSAQPGPSRLAIDSRNPKPVTDPDSDDSDQKGEEWLCDCIDEAGACGPGQGDHCDCVATFGNFYTSSVDSHADMLNLDALPERLPLVECGPACPCGDSCMNRITQRGLRIPIHVRPLASEGIGLGAFYSPGTGEPLAQGTFICLYAGEYLSTTQAKERWSVNHDGVGEGNYILTLRLPGQRIHIDPRYKGNAGRFFNHSCDPSCVVHVVRWGGSNVWPRAAIFAKRDIRPDEELTYDYANASGATSDIGNITETATRGTTRCLCGAASCRGWMPYDPDV